MKFLISTLYVALILIANRAVASEADKLQIHQTPLAPSEIAVTTEDGEELIFGPSDTKLRVVNLWALWCVSCRKEMPTLDAMSEDYEPEDLQVYAVAVGRNDPEKVAKFFEKIGVQHLPVYYDEKQKYAADVGAVAIPVTLFLNSKGEEVARIIGEGDYLDADLRAKIDTLVTAGE